LLCRAPAGRQVRHDRRFAGGGELHGVGGIPGGGGDDRDVLASEVDPAQRAGADVAQFQATSFARAPVQ
jgi:hypothetical protein